MSEKIIEATKNDDIEGVKSEIACGANVNITSQYGENALEWACFNKNAKIVDLLLASGADVNAVGSSGHNALMIACREGYIKIAKLLLANGADVKAKSKNGATAKEIASMNRHTKLVKILEDYEKNEKQHKAQEFKEIIAFTPAQIVAPENRAKLNKVVHGGKLVEAFKAMEYNQQEALLNTMYEQISSDEKMMKKIIPIIQATFEKVSQDQNTKPNVQQIKLFETFALQFTR